jgi:SAM-dependent methyltransferase
MSEYVPLAEDHVDSYVDMMMRREINNFADEPVDFYQAGFKIAEQHLTLGPDDAVLDIGCSSGRFVVEAAAASGVPSYLIGIDPDPVGHEDFFPQGLDHSRFTFIQGVGEDIPLPDNSVRVVHAHNVLFRTNDALEVLNEAKRVTEPGGLIMISTNATDHAHWRHSFERIIAVEVGRRTGMLIDPLQPPAHGYYLDDMPDIVAASGGLEIVDTLVQQCAAKITEDRLAVYLYSLQLSANRLPDSGGNIRRIWREVIAENVVPFIQRRINDRAELFKLAHDPQPPYFQDSVHRGLFVLRNVKPQA